MKVGVVGLGYVGLPLAVEFGKKMDTVGYDLSENKVNSYRSHIDPTGEVATEDLKAATWLKVSTDIKLVKWEDLPQRADAVVVAVKHKQYLDKPLAEILGLVKAGGAFIDIKSAFDANAVRANGFRLWRL